MQSAKYKAMHVKRGDQVLVTRGDDAGRQGKVLQVLRLKGRAVVEGLNLVKRHVRKTKEKPEGGIVEKEAPIALSKLRLVEVEKEKSKKGSRKKSA